MANKKLHDLFDECYAEAQDESRSFFIGKSVGLTPEQLWDLSFRITQRFNKLNEAVVRQMQVEEHVRRANEKQEFSQEPNPVYRKLGITESQVKKHEPKPASSDQGLTKKEKAFLRQTGLKMEDLDKYN